ncbi:hypothetical protein Kisp02_13370 [Kineosporia sp. NBRC 101731]|nr:hypothetical protein Kisp02_13370 [Kineosporia sp. NBRC 101731]
MCAAAVLGVSAVLAGPSGAALASTGQQTSVGQNAAGAVQNADNDDKKTAKKKPSKKSAKKKKAKKKKPARPTKPTCTNVGKPGSDVSAVPWQQKWISPERLAPLANGSGQVVAIVDSGVDIGNRQLKGRVQSGYDVTRGGGVLGGYADCLPHGTGVASMIVADQVDTAGFRGIAPQAEIMPVRVTLAVPATGPGGTEGTNPARVAKGIIWAAQNGATVIEVSSSFRGDDADKNLKKAVQFALRRGIPVVAAVGDIHNADLPSDPLTYPAAYPGVIGVGSLAQDFTVAGTSAVSSAVDVVAPGEAVIASALAGGQQQYSGTSLAAGVVAGTVALVRQTSPSMTPDEIAKRLVATADPMPAGASGLAYGAGLINPYRAITERASVASAQQIAGAAVPTVDPVAVRTEKAREHAQGLAFKLAGLVVGLVVLLAIIALALPRGRRRSWVPGRAEPAATTRPRPEIPLEEESPFALPETNRG